MLPPPDHNSQTAMAEHTDISIIAVKIIERSNINTLLTYYVIKLLIKKKVTIKPAIYCEI